MRSLFLDIEQYVPSCECRPYANCWHQQHEKRGVLQPHDDAQPLPSITSTSSLPTTTSTTVKNNNGIPNINTRHSSSFFIGLMFHPFIAGPTPLRVDLHPVIYEFQRRVMSWPNMKPGMSLGIKV